MSPKIQNRLAAIVSLLSALTVPTTPTDACVYAVPTVRVGRAFRIQVRDHELRVRGLRLELAEDDGRGEIVVTDADGVVRFSGRKPGIYRVAAAQDSGFANELNIEVAEDGPADVMVPLTWPAEAPIRVRAASGTLYSIAPKVSVSLFEGLSARQLQTTDTDMHGHFAFSDVPPGLYFLGVASRGLPAELKSDVGDRIAIELTSGAEEEQLDLDLSWSDCGLSYADRNKCSQEGLRVSNLCGRVVDSMGAAIAKAEVILDGGPGVEVLKRIQSDSSGGFTLGELKDGEYQLSVRSSGFHALQIPVRIQNTGSSKECAEPIYVTLGAGACSRAEILAGSSHQR